VLDGPTNRHAFETYVEKVLVAELRQDAVAIVDNLSSHKGPRIREMIEASGAALLYLQPTAPTSTRSRMLSSGSKQICERLPTAPSMVFGMLLVASSTPTRPRNPQTTAPPQDICNLIG
jgi:hypothetical protein